jgi:hypothetical protein
MARYAQRTTVTHGMRRLVVAVAAILVALPAGGARASGALPFTFLAPGYTQELYATDGPFAAGVAFAPDGDPLLGFGTLLRVDAATTISQHGSTYHPVSLVNGSSPQALGIVNAFDGSVYANQYNGVVKLDGTTGAVVAGPFGAPGNELGIALDPQTGNLVYVGADGMIHFVDAALTTQGVFSTQAVYADGINFDPTGNFLFTSSGGGLTVLDRFNHLVRAIPLAGGCCTDGIAFHEDAPRFVVSNNTDGTVTRYDFPGNDFTQVPTQSLLASGGFRGDLLQVGRDRCAYLTQSTTRFDDGAISGAGSLVRLCPGFASPNVPSDQIDADQPTWWWRLGESSGTTMVAAAGGKNGVLKNGVVLGQPGALAGDANTAALFNGSAAYASVSGIAAPKSAYTMEIWMKANAALQDGTLIDQGGAGALYVKTDRFCFRQTTTSVCWAQPPVAGVWYHVVGSWDKASGVARLYVDGVERASGPAPAAPSGSGTLYIGYGSAAPWFKGYLDEPAYYSTALSPGRVAAHYHAGCGC